MNTATPTNPTPRPAATMIVLREHETQLEVLMTRRHANLAFMGGMWVFPGGRLAPADQSAAALKRLLNTDGRTPVLKDLQGAALPMDLAQSLAITACRETFEETGVLLATHADGSACSPEQLAHLQAERAAIAKEPERFIALLEREALFLDAARFVYWAHWITPEQAPRRFDTRFFLAAAPGSHAFQADTYETTECAWMSPANLLGAADRDEMKIAQPTRCNLEALQAAITRHRTLDALLRGEATRRISPILPKLHTEGQRELIVYPWDADYRTFAGEGVPDGDQHYEPALLALPSRADKDH